MIHPAILKKLETKGWLRWTVATVFIIFGAVGVGTDLYDRHEADEAQRKTETRIESKIDTLISVSNSKSSFHRVSPKPSPARMPEGPLPQFHITRQQMGATDVTLSNGTNAKQLFANIYISNDGDNAITEKGYLNSGISVTPDQKGLLTNAKKLNDIVMSASNVGNGIPHTLYAKEQIWFTVPGPTISLDDFSKFQNAHITFYFAGVLVGKNSHGKTTIPFCGFNQGKPEVIFDCAP